MTSNIQDLSVVLQIEIVGIFMMHTNAYPHYYDIHYMIRGMLAHMFFIGIYHCHTIR
jgi:hypothetical protein